MNKIKWLAILLSLGFSLASYAQTVPHFNKGESYTNVRAKMLKAGWKPYHSPDADECMKGDSRCQGRPEMESCAGTGMANCRFLWKKQEKTVGICTVGEENNSFSGMCN